MATFCRSVYVMYMFVVRLTSRHGNILPKCIRASTRSGDCVPLGTASSCYLPDLSTIIVSNRWRQRYLVELEKMKE
ncbi:hypothetical protein RRG08_044956 [Elysia crispata]|uniref:Uncharacterized protein n=1 Tax=Elysia crispata TaxID=231223 RepID=A0AAE0ZTI2_9GAST|nr:hypothetical protein RRG08_044956 [Elysia crispata]